MVRRISSSQFRSKLRQIENKQKQAIRNYNNAATKYNRNVKATVNKYNQAVRQHNTNVRRNRSNIQNELNKLRSSRAFRSQYFVQYRASSLAMHNSYNTVVGISDSLEGLSPQQERIYELVEQEHANNLFTANVLLSDEEPELETITEQDSFIGGQLATICIDLSNRWKGAVFSLNPNNPDATRHFCTSAREIFAEIIEMKAPDCEVFKLKPSCDKTEKGNATRREKISFLLRTKGIDSSVEEFVDNDISNILDLFRTLSAGTHGEAGKYNITKLKVIKKRVEDGINFLCNIAL